MPRVVLVLPTATYRATDFLDAARALDAEVVVASEERQAMAHTMGDRFVHIDLCEPEGSAATIARQAAKADAVVGVDEQGVLIAAMAAETLGLAHNSPNAVAITRDKAKLRRTLTNAGLPQPSYEPIEPHDDGTAAAAKIGFPCVIKATTLSGSRGVVRCDDEEEVRAATQRVREITGTSDELLVEQYVPGAEVALEGLLDDGTLLVLAIFDKPDPLEGPYFEETIYVTPSRHGKDVEHAIERSVADACAAVGLVDGPIHAEVRLPPDGQPVVLEVAARSIGGLCSRALKFGAGISLEELILRHSLGLALGDLGRARAASGVMMIPIAHSGVLSGVDGIDEARAVSGVDGLEITIPRGQAVKALPEGDRYLGFMFASGPTPADVEEALREAFTKLRIEIEASREDAGRRGAGG